MRTAIFVYEPSEVSIDTSEVGLALVDLNGSSKSLDGRRPLTLDRGVYCVISERPLNMSFGGKSQTSVELGAGDLKDQVPKPRPQVILETDAASPKYEEFKRAFESFFPVMPRKND